LVFIVESEFGFGLDKSSYAFPVASIFATVIANVSSIFDCCRGSGGRKGEEGIARSKGIKKEGIDRKRSTERGEQCGR